MAIMELFLARVNMERCCTNMKGVLEAVLNWRAARAKADGRTALVMRG